MNDCVEFQFHIDALHPDTIPMERLALYLIQLAKLLGNQTQVHFDRLEEGSLSILNRVECRALEDVRSRLNLIGTEAPEIAKPYRELNDLLARDNATATLGELGADHRVIPFPGRNRQHDTVFKITQAGSLEGVVIRVGGKDKTAHVNLVDETDEPHSCIVSRDLAKELAAHLYGAPVRLNGEGTWIRDGAGKWSLDQFRASGFEVLEATSLSDAIAELRNIPGSGWHEEPDPIHFLLSMRGD